MDLSEARDASGRHTGTPEGGRNAPEGGRLFTSYTHLLGPLLHSTPWDINGLPEPEAGSNPPLHSSFAGGHHPPSSSTLEWQHRPQPHTHPQKAYSPPPDIFSRRAMGELQHPPSAFVAVQMARDGGDDASRSQGASPPPLQPALSDDAEVRGLCGAFWTEKTATPRNFHAQPLLCRLPTRSGEQLAGGRSAGDRPLSLRQ